MKETEREFLINELGPLKVKAAYMLVEMDLAAPDYEGPKTQDELAEALGIGRTALWQWRTKDRNFIKLKNSITDDFLEENYSMVTKQLLSLIKGKQPSVKAIDIYAKLTGRYDNKVTIRNEDVNTGGESNEDLAKSLESLQKMKAVKETEGK